MWLPRKPDPWSFSRQATDPSWDWFWDAAAFASPCWPGNIYNLSDKIELSGVLQCKIPTAMTGKPRGAKWGSGYSADSGVQIAEWNKPSLINGAKTKFTVIVLAEPLLAASTRYYSAMWGGNNHRRWAIGQWSTGYYAMRRGINTVASTIYSTTAVEAGVPRLLIGSYNITEGDCRFFVGGVEEASAAWTSVDASTNADFTMFDYGLTIYGMGAFLDDLAVTPAQARQLAEDPWGPFRMRDEAAITYSLPSGAITVPVGLASETDTAFAVARAKAQSVRLATETATAFPVSVVKTRAVGLTSEADSALAVTRAKTRAAGLTSEADTAFPVTALTGVPVGLASETDSALAVARAKTRAVGLASEADTAFPVAALTGVQVGLATETATAFPVQRIKLRGVGLAIETDSAFGITRVKAVPVGQTAEADSAFPVTRAKSRSVGLALETDTALPLILASSGMVPLHLFASMSG